MDNQVEFSGVLNETKKSVDQLSTNYKNLVGAVGQMGVKTADELKKQNQTNFSNLQAKISSDINALNLSSQIRQLKTDLTNDLKPQSNNGLMLILGVGFLANFALSILNYLKKSPAVHELQPVTA